MKPSSIQGIKHFHNDNHPSSSGSSPWITDSTEHSYEELCTHLYLDGVVQQLTSELYIKLGHSVWRDPCYATPVVYPKAKLGSNRSWGFLDLGCGPGKEGQSQYLTFQP